MNNSEMAKYRTTDFTITTFKQVGHKYINGTLYTLNDYNKDEIKLDVSINGESFEEFRLKLLAKNTGTIKKYNLKISNIINFTPDSIKFELHEKYFYTVLINYSDYKLELTQADVECISLNGISTININSNKLYFKNLINSNT